MFGKVIVGTDFSPASEVVLSCLPHLKAVGLEEVFLAHVIHVANTPGLEELLRQTYEPLLDQQSERLEAAGLKVTAEMPTGIPAVVLSDLAEKHDASAIVVGSHGRSLLGRVLLGSVSSSVLEHTARPVLLVRMAICQTEEGVSCDAVPFERMLERLLFPTDFSDASEHAFAGLRRIVAETHSAVTLLHVQDQVRLKHLTARLQEFDRIDQERLDRMGGQLKEAGASNVDTKIVFGVPTRLIVREAAEIAPCLIVMGTKGRGAIEEVAVGSVAAGVARLAPVPILFLPMPR